MWIVFTVPPLCLVQVVESKGNQHLQQPLEENSKQLLDKQVTVNLLAVGQVTMNLHTVGQVTVNHQTVE